jgi:UDP-N-acetylglucosamine 2-epimerase
LARERSSILETLGVEPGGYAVATVHREANVRPDRLARIAEGLSRLADPVVLPAHPRTRQAIAGNTVLLGTNVALIDPLGYMDFAALASQARVILTDSGGLQKEAYWYGVPCVTLRPSTEWKDTVELGANVLVDDDPDAIVDAAARASMPPNRPELYGDGRAADRIADILISL